MRAQQTSLALAAIAVMMSALQGCAQPAGEAATDQHQLTANLSFGRDDSEPLLPTPLQAYRLTPSELATVGYARGILIDRCMQRFGLSYPQSPYPEVLEAALSSERVAIGRLYGITDPGAAAAYGYGFPPSPRDDRPGDELRDHAYLQVLHGDLDPRQREPAPATFAGTRIPRGGCAGEADREIGQTDKTTSLYGLAHTWWIQDQTDLRASQGYRTVIGHWVACMAAHGFHVTDPVSDHGDIAAIYAARRAANDEALTGDPVNGEAVLATTDVTCKRTVNLVGRLNALGAAIDTGTIAAHRRALERDRRRLDRQVHRATALVREVGE